jgi:hypothetical protein
MSQANRNKRRRRPAKNRRRWPPKVTCKDVFFYGPLVLFFLFAGIGPFVYEFWHHRNLLFGLILSAVIAMFIFLLWQGRA